MPKSEVEGRVIRDHAGDMEREDGKLRAQRSSICILQVEIKQGFIEKIQNESKKKCRHCNNVRIK